MEKLNSCALHPSFEIVIAYVHHLSHIFFAKKVILEWLTNELSTNIVRKVSEKQFYLHLDFIAALL